MLRMGGGRPDKPLESTAAPIGKSSLCSWLGWVPAFAGMTKLKGFGQLGGGRALKRTRHPYPLRHALIRLTASAIASVLPHTTAANSPAPAPRRNRRRA